MGSCSHVECMVPVQYKNGTSSSKKAGKESSTSSKPWEPRYFSQELWTKPEIKLQMDAGLQQVVRKRTYAHVVLFLLNGSEATVC